VIVSTIAKRNVKKNDKANIGDIIEFKRNERAYLGKVIMLRETSVMVELLDDLDQLELNLENNRTVVGYSNIKKLNVIF